MLDATYIYAENNKKNQFFHGLSKTFSLLWVV